MNVVVHQDIGDLADDLADIARRVKPDMRGVVKDGIRVGRDLARENAKRTAGAHGVHYPKAITDEMTGELSGEYGPDPAMPQGGMSFERGSRNQPPHNDLAKSADVIGPSFLRSVDDQVREWFW